MFQPSSKFANQCQNPRTGTDPGTGKPYLDVQGTTLDENNFLRSWTNELYLWYSEVQDNDPANYSTTASYFDTLKTMAKTSTGADKDRFHFTYPTSQWEQLQQSGVELGYGVTWELVAAAPPRTIKAAFVWAGGQALADSMARGDEVLTIDGVDAVNANDQASVDKLNAGLFPQNAGEKHVFGMRTLSGVNYSVTLTSASVTENPVPLVNWVSNGSGGTVGYMLFTTHIATAETALINAVTQLQNQHITDLVLDMRYNGGGYLYIASELAYMIAGPGPTTGKTFDLQQWNNKHPSTNPVTGCPITPTPFIDASQALSSSSCSTSSSGGTPLPYLALPRVYVLTGSGTCSASEAVINGLNGVGVQVTQVGSTTCGKPYGFYPQDDCGTTYFSIEFQGVNAQGFGNYPDGFSPSNSPQLTSAVLPGCAVADDYSMPLGDPHELRFAVALGLQAGGSCPQPTGVVVPRLSAQDHAALRPPPWRMNRILRGAGRL
ncbi:MAG: peptidase [Proteobacteria bacterium]|nr:peptidase [Pseudomonadota bacterium]